MRLTGKGWAVALMVLSALCFSLMQMSSTLCGDIPAMEQVFFRNLVSMVLYSLVWRRGVPRMGRRDDQPRLLAWSVSGCLNVLFLFIAAKGGAQGSLTIIGRASGFLVVPLAALLLKEKVFRVQYVAVFLAFVGAALTVSPSGGGMDSFTLGMASLSALFGAAASISMGLLKERAHALTVAFHFSVVSLVISAPFLPTGFVVPGPEQLPALVGIGLFGGLGQLTQMWAFERAPVGEINIFGYSGILFSMLLGVLFLGEGITPGAALGGALVVAASAWSFLAVRSRTKMPVKES